MNSPVTEPNNGDSNYSLRWLNQVNFSDAGLVCAIAQDAVSGRILMVAWMNQEALIETVATGRAVYWSRSRNRLWRKGEESGNTQRVREVRLDCDGDVVLLQVEQHGGIACHTGRQSCLFRILRDGNWESVDPVLKDPDQLYGKKD
ncbi:MAG: phosphoribosyl-AMP cyclohydrolase [Burkholderiaceae bacterium]